MKSKKEIIKTVKVLAICVIVFLILLISYHFIVNGPGPKKVDNTPKYSVYYEEVNKDYENPTMCMDGYLLLENKRTNKTLLLNDKLTVIETLNNPSDITCLYDGYYLINNGANYTLKKASSIVAGNLNLTTLNNREKVYNDASLKDSLYISYMYLYNVVNKKNVSILGNTSYMENENGGILLNNKNGNIIDGNIQKLNKVNDNYLYYVSDSNYLYDYVNSQKINLGTKELTLENNAKYLVYQDSGNEGVMDYQGNIVIPSASQDILIDSNNENYLAIKKDDKYGLIKINNETVWNTEFDRVIVLDNYVLKINNSNLTIYNNNLEVIGNYIDVSKDLKWEKYANFYYLENSLGNSFLIIKDNIKEINKFKYVSYSELFFDKPLFLVSNGRNYELMDENITRTLNLNGSLDLKEAYVINNDELLVSYNDYSNNWIDNYYRISNGISIKNTASAEKTKETEVIRNGNLIFSRENNTITAYYNNNNKVGTIKDAVKISHLVNDYYVLEKDNKKSLMEIRVS